MKTIKNIIRFVAGLIIFVAMNVAIADHLPIGYNIGGTIVYFTVIGLWLWLANRRTRRHAYEPFNRR